MKLDTTTAVLEWAEGMPQRSEVDPTDTETAARLALGQRVLSIVERLAEHPRESERANGDSETAHYILAEAAKEEGK